MQRVVVPGFDAGSLRAAVDTVFYARGVQYAREGAVVQMRWDPERLELQGLVRGSGGTHYTTIAYFTPAYLSEADDYARRRLSPHVGSWQAEDGVLAFERGICSCPVGSDCKHVIALALTAVDSKPGTQQLTRGAPGPAGAASRPLWQASLDALLQPPPAGPLNRGPVTPLAIELTLTPASRTAASRWQPQTDLPPRLTARLVQAGKNGGWVAGTLSWLRLESLSFSGNYAPAQVQALQEIFALSMSGVGHYGYYGNDKVIDMGAFGSRQLWSLLDAAAETGIRLVRARKLGELPRYREAELRLDVTGQEDQGDSAAGGLMISPVLWLDPVGQPADAIPILFIGKHGHGVVYADRAEAERGGDCGSWRFQLARLRTEVPQQLQSMALAGSRLAVSADEAATFREVYYPRLRRSVAITSSDSSFEPPPISGPTLVLRACYRPGHRVELDWEWAYQVGDSRLRAAPEPANGPGTGLPTGDGYRDADAERALLTGLDAPLESFGLARAGPGGRVLVPNLELAGIDTMRFTTELLPLLYGQAPTGGEAPLPGQPTALDQQVQPCQPAVVVEVTGEQPDYREAGDSLRIGVASEAVDGDPDWFDLGVSITVDGQTVPFTDVFVALSHGESHLLLADGAYFSLDKPELQALARLIEEARALQDAPPGELRISRFQAGLWDELTQFGVVSHQAARWREQVAGLLSLSSVEPRRPPADLSARLRPYQLDGYSWLAFLWEHQLGGILADDMGLGKTLQSLALICHARAASPGSPPFLIVAPTSVVANWVAEAGRFAPDLTVVPVLETDARRGGALAGLIAGADAVVTSYTLLRLDADSYCGLTWAGVILDEAQFVKNHLARIYQCARRLPAPFKLAITGTPMENNLMELWSLLSITAPGLFPNPARFREYYARPIEKSGDAELLAQFRQRIRPLVRRRTKEQVAADLPAKQEQVIEVDLHPRHRKVYQTHLQRERQKVLRLIDDLNAHRFTIFRSLTLLRQLSLHAGLVDEALADVPSSKVELLVEQLGDVIGGGHRALVFSQFTSFLRLVRERLDAEGVPYCYLDGRTRDRAAEIERFTAGSIPVFLISLKAGGFGLNLTEADYCFLLDPWWNPATEAQAVDRAHRIGQTRNVMVYRLIARDTIEEKVMALKTRKAELFASVLDEGNAFGASLDAEDIRGLFA